MASFKERGNGKIWVRVLVKEGNKNKQLTYTANSMEEAKQWAEQMEARRALERGEGESMTVLDLHNAYAGRGVSQATKEADEYRITRMLDFLGGVRDGDSEAAAAAKRARVTAEMATPAKCEDYLYQTHLHFNTLRRDVIYLRCILRRGSYTHLDKMVIGSERIERKRLPTYDEYNQLLRHAGPAHRWIIMLLFESGWRRSEVYQLRPRDVRLGENPVADFIDVKTGQRKVRIMTDSCAVLLAEILADHARRGRGPNDRICRYSSAHEITQMIRRSRQAAGLGEHVHAHAFRHLFITEMQSKAHLTGREVMDFTGHTDIQTVMRYTQATAQVARAKARGIDRAKPTVGRVETDRPFFME